MEGRRLIFYDQRGRGGSSSISDKSSVWTDYEVKDIESIRRFHDLESFSLVGWSYMGGVIALYANEYSERVRRLVLVCPIPIRQPAPYESDQNKAWEESKKRIDQVELRKLEQMKEDGLEELDPEKYCRQHHRVYLPVRLVRAAAIDRIVDDSCRYENEWPKNHEEHLRRHFPAESRIRDWREKMSRVQQPVLVIHGREDFIPLAASKEWAATLPNARMLVIPDSGHFPQYDAPEQFLPAVAEFLGGSWPDGAKRVDVS